MQHLSHRHGNMLSVPCNTAQHMLSWPRHSSHLTQGRYFVYKFQRSSMAVKPWGTQQTPPACAQPLRASMSSWNPVEVVKREQGLQSNKVSGTVRDKVVGTVEQLRFRCTAGDVAARSGLRPQEAESVLQALAYDTGGTLEVSQEGTIVYELPRDFRSILQTRSLLLQLAPVGAAAQKLGAYLLRVAFGSALIASISVVWLAIMVLSSGSRERDDDEKRKDRRSRGGHNHSFRAYHYGRGPSVGLYFDLTDLLMYLDPKFGSTAQERLASGAQLTFTEALFSFVFGDGDPNHNYDSLRWTALGQLIQDKGGVVTAEEMAPFLDPPMPQKGASRPVFADEAFVLPALIRFGGEPVVEDATGTIVYRFPAFQQTAQGERFRLNPLSYQREIPLEEDWEVTAASGGQLVASIGLGLLNVAGVVVLSSMLSDPRARYMLAVQGLSWVAGLMPALQMYAFAFFAIPSVRWAIYAVRNQAINARNAARLAAAQAVNGPDRWLNRKLVAARQLGERRVLRRQDAVFRSDREAVSQMNELAEDEWDKRLNSRG